jgi:hypothetical protein
VRGNSRALSDAPSWRELVKEILESRKAKVFRLP